ncbi:hypothetical protein VaNZ11_010146, partial [Volvox africanus]
MRQKNVECSTAEATRAYLRDVRKYLQLVRGSDRNAVRCLFVRNTLKGRAKTWYDQWTTAKETFTFDELTAALFARFAPEVQNPPHPILRALPIVSKPPWEHGCRPQSRLRQPTGFWLFRSIYQGRGAGQDAEMKALKVANARQHLWELPMCDVPICKAASST